MNRYDMNLEGMRETVLKLEITQYAQAEARRAKEELREDIRESIRLETLSLRNEARDDRRKFLRYAIAIFTIIIGGDIWTVWSTINRATESLQKALQTEVEKNRQNAATVLATETHTMQDQIRSRLNHEFETPRLQQMIGEEAQKYTANQAQAYINTQVDAVLKPFRTQVSEQMSQLTARSQELQQNERQLAKTTAESEKLTKSLSGQVLVQNHRNAVYTLGAAAIGDGGQRASLTSLVSILDDRNEAQDIRQSAEAEILRIKSFWLGIDKIRDAEFTWKGRDGTLKKEEELTSCDLMFELRNNSLWVVRAKAARMLGGWRKTGIAEALLRSIQTDSQLHTVKDAVRSFERVTGYRSPDVFGGPSIESWWQAHGAEITKTMQPLDCEVR